MRVFRTFEQKKNSNGMIFLLCYLGVLPDTGLVLALRITTMLISVNTTHDIVNRHQKFLIQTTIGIIHNAMSVVNWNGERFVSSRCGLVFLLNKGEFYAVFNR